MKLHAGKEKPTNSVLLHFSLRLWDLPQTTEFQLLQMKHFVHPWVPLNGL